MAASPFVATAGTLKETGTPTCVGAYSYPDCCGTGKVYLYLGGPAACR